MQSLFASGRAVRRLAATVLVGLGAVAAGCDEEARPAAYVPEELVGDDPASIVVERLTATIGPEGGTLAGAADGAFAGFSLEIPAGALAAPTEVSVAGVVDPTPLALTAARVGPQFALEPAGLELAVPARLTVPFDPDLRQGWDVPDADCRVWYRDGEGWSKADQTGSTAEGVSIELPRLTTVAAGVFAVSRVPACQLRGDCPPSVGDQGCLVGETFCLTRLVPPPAPAFDFNSITVQDGQAWYLTSPGLNQYAIVTYDLASTVGAATTSVALAAPPTRTVSTRGRVAVEPNGNLWLGLVGYGNVRFRAAASATRFDTSSALSPQGLLFLPIEQRIMRFTLENGASGREVVGVLSNTPRFRLGVGVSDTPISVLGIRQDGRAAALVGGSIALATSRSGLYPRPGVPDSFLDVCGASATLSATYDVSSRQQAVACQGNRVSNGIARQLAEPGHAISSLAIDNAQNVYVVDATIAQITRIDALGGVTTVGLSSAQPGTAAYDRLLPRAIRYEPAFDMLVLFTRGSNASGAPDVYLIEQFKD
ncbi:MAG: hypothetical protein H6706_28935 [Myxococcales bacterium]|nr:hypothetical protein [Myxococcales bacterium]